MIANIIKRREMEMRDKKATKHGTAAGRHGGEPSNRPAAKQAAHAFRCGVSAALRAIAASAVIAAAVSASADNAGGNDGTLSLPGTGEFSVAAPSAEAQAPSSGLSSSMDPATGRATFSAELMRLDCQGVSVPFVLSYTTGGLRLGHEQGRFGAGWSLSAGGFVSREIRGLPDPVGSPASLRAFGSAYIDSASDLLRLVQGIDDSMADMFTFQAGSCAGHFIVVSNHGAASVVQLPESGARISIGAGMDIDILTPDGCAYHYEPAEEIGRTEHPFYIDALERPSGLPRSVRSWRIEWIASPQRTDTVRFHYSPLPDKTLPTRDEKTWSVTFSNANETAAPEQLTNAPSLPSSYGTTKLYSRCVLDSVTCRAGTIALDDSICTAMRLIAPDGSEAARVDFSYLSGGFSMLGERMSLLKGYVASTGSSPIDGAWFEYYGEGSPMQSDDLFGYCNDPRLALCYPNRGAYEFAIVNGEGDFYPFGMDSYFQEAHNATFSQITGVSEDFGFGFQTSLQLIPNPSRRQSPEHAMLNSLRSAATASGLVTRIEYEPSAVPGGWGAPEGSADLCIGLRVKSIEVSDTITGSVRRTEYEYRGAVPSIPFVRSLGAYAAAGGSRSLNWSSLPHAYTYTTGFSLLSRSRAPGASMQEATVSYARVRQRVSGTGLPCEAVTDYEFEPLELPAGSLSAPSSDYMASRPIYKGSLAHAGQSQVGGCGQALLRPQPLASYTCEFFGASAMPVSVTEWRVRASGDTVPARVTLYCASYSSLRDVAVGYYSESMLRTNSSGGVVREASHSSEADFNHGPVIARCGILRVDTVRIIEYGDDGSSRTVTSSFAWNDRIDGLQAPGGGQAAPSVRSNCLLRYSSTECAGEKVETWREYSADAPMLLGEASTASSAAFRGWTALPVSAETRDGSALTKTAMEYAGTGMAVRLSRETVRTGSGALLDSVAVLGHDSWGNPLLVTRMGLPAVSYGWTADGLHLARVSEPCGLVTEYSHKPLAGLASATLPSGLVLSYSYDGVRLVEERRNGTVTATYELAIWAFSGGDDPCNSASRLIPAGSGRKLRTDSYYSGAGQLTGCSTGLWGSAPSMSQEFTSYDALGRPVRRYAPVGGSCPASYAGMEAAALQAYGDTAAFSRFTYSSGASQSPRSATIPGEHFAGHPAVTSVVFNREPGQTLPSARDRDLACPRYGVDDSGRLTLSGCWPAGSLRVEETTDGDGCRKLAFTDFRGRTVMLRTIAPVCDPGLQPMSLGDVYARNDTHFVYDDAGLLRYVLPPTASAALSAGSPWSAGDCEALARDAYCFAYDESRRPVWAKAPGCEPVETVYDLSGRPVLTVDGEQRMRGACSFELADSAGRPALRGECADTEALRAQCATSVAVASFGAEGGQLLAGYSVSIHLEGASVDRAWYYDGYGFLESDEFAPVRDRIRVYAQPSLSRGMETGSLCRILAPGDTAGFVARAVGYDSCRRPSACVSSSLGGGADAEFVSYDAADRPVSSVRTSYDASGAPAARLYAEYSYGPFGKLSSVRAYATPGSQSQAVSRLSYDQAGRLLSDRLGSVLTVGYSRTPDGSVSAIALDGEPWLSVLPGQQRSGRAGSLEWVSRDAGARRYDYSYDMAGRLASAQYSEEGSRGANYSCSYSYDRMGNPVRIVRSGLTDVYGSGPGADLSFGTVDDLELHYSGPMLASVEDAADDPPYSGAMDFSDGASLPSEYAYDACGRMVSDANAGIDTVSYNRIGLPMEVRMSSGAEVQFFYSADGTLLRRIVRTPLSGSGSIIPSFPHTGGAEPASLHGPGLPGGTPVRPAMTSAVTNYRGPFIFSGNTLDRTLIPMGYLRGDTAYYYVRDHQGSVRQVVNGATGEVVQETHYYPYGMPFGESAANALSGLNGASENPLKYGGKELVRARSLSFYDFSARPYDPSTARFWTSDPLRLETPEISSYVYCASDPANFIDPTGKEAIMLIDNDSETVTIKANYYVLNEPDHPELFNCMQFTTEQIQSMADLVRFLNSKSLRMPEESEYAGYNILFDLQFFSVTVFDLSFKPRHDVYRVDDKTEFKIGNSVRVGSQYDSVSFVRDRFALRTENVTGRTEQRYGFAGKDYIFMYKDALKDRLFELYFLHEVFHTLYMTHPEGIGGPGGLMRYPPEAPGKWEENHFEYTFPAERKIIVK